MPIWNVSSQYTFYCSSVKADENFAVLSFLKKYICFWAFLTTVEMWDDHDRFFVMLITRDLKLFTCSTDADRGVCFCLLFSKISDCPPWFCLHWAVGCAALCKIVDFFPIWSLIIMVVSSANFKTEFSPCLGLQSWVHEQEGAEHTALGGSGVAH